MCGRRGIFKYSCMYPYMSGSMHNPSMYVYMCVRIYALYVTMNVRINNSSIYKETQTSLGNM